jgi:cysteine sulfinate desulfinase/cysteine desulfurase-like protein
MVAMGLAPEVIDGSFRVSICKDTTQEELDKLVDVIERDILTRTR